MGIDAIVTEKDPRQFEALCSNLSKMSANVQYKLNMQSKHETDLLEKQEQEALKERKRIAEIRAEIGNR